MADFDERFNDHAAELAGTGIELRTGTADDADLIRRVVAIAGHWRDDVVPHELPAELDKYHHGWSRPGDLAVLAFQGIEFAGGAYVRCLDAADGAYGYISDDYPELTIGVEAPFRGRGLGVILLAAIKAKVIEADMAGISLSVEPDNDARHLYAKLSFELIEDRRHDLLMLWRRPT